MKKDKMKHPIRGEELVEQAQKVMEKEGSKGWNLAKEVMLNQKIQSLQLKKAINYVMLQYKPDFFRPAIISFCSKVVGGSSEATVQCGASSILLARAIGIHDDIIDNLKIRNKRPTVFGEFGRENALILSDILSFKGFKLLGKIVEFGVSYRSIANIYDTIDRIWFEQSESEALEVQSRGKTETTPKKCLTKIMMRASEMEATTRIGGILGGGSEKEIEVLGRYGRFLGMASILRNELIDILELDMLRHRIKRESLPLPLIYALTNTSAKPKILSLISMKRPRIKDLQTVSKVVEEANGLRYVAKLVNRNVRNALSCVAFFGNRSKNLKLLASSTMIDRKYCAKSHPTSKMT
jgi:geranylgeranyl pyrophosphate synthase